MGPDDHHDRELSELLQMWDADGMVPRGFRPAVWSRIAAREEARGRHSAARGYQILARILTRPAFAAAAAVALAVGAAHLHARAVTDSRRTSAESAYLAAISPVARVARRHSGLEREPLPLLER